MKTRFNHDWLKNRASLAVSALLQQLRRDNLSDFWELPQIHILEEWNYRRDEAMHLFEGFPFEMSPRRFFKESPLCYFDKSTKLWVGDLVHDIWLERCAVQQWVDGGKIAVSKVDSALFACGVLKSPTNAIYRNVHVPDIADITNLSQALRSLSNILSTPPRLLP